MEVKLNEEQLQFLLKQIIFESKESSRTYIAVITGPEELIPDGNKIYEIYIDQEMIDEFLDDGDETETEQDAIDYYLEEYENEWNQRFCSVKFYTPQQFSKIFKHVPSKKFRRRIN